MATYKLVSSSGPPQDWWGAWVDIPATATVLDFVFEDGSKHVRDNNKGLDFHTVLENPMSSGQLVQLTYEKLKAQSKEDDIRQEDHRAHVSAKKVMRKVWGGCTCYY